MKIRRRGQARPEMPTAVVGFLGKGSQPPPHQLGGLGERCKIPLRGPGPSPGRPSGFLYFIDARWLFLAFSSRHFVGGGLNPNPPLKYGPVS